MVIFPVMIQSFHSTLHGIETSQRLDFRRSFIFFSVEPKSRQAESDLTLPTGGTAPQLNSFSRVVLPVQIEQPIRRHLLVVSRANEASSLVYLPSCRTQEVGVFTSGIPELGCHWRFCEPD